MPSPEHEAYQALLHTTLPLLAQHPDDRDWILAHTEIILLLFLLDLGPARPLLAAGYAANPRGGDPWDPVVVLRALILALLLDHPALNDWAPHLRHRRLFRVLCGITPPPPSSRRADSPSVGAFYGFFHRLHDGPLGHDPAVALSPSAAQRQRAATPRPSQRQERQDAPREEGVTAALLEQIRARTALAPPTDLLARLHPLLLAVAIGPSAERGLLGEVGALITVGDGSPLPTMASGRGQRVCACPTRRCECARTYADPDARWGWDEYRQTYFFGHHFYEISCPVRGHDLPLFLALHPGNTSDFTASLEAYERLGKGLREQEPTWRVDIAVLDAGHDALAVHEGLRDWRIRPVIPLKQAGPAAHPTRPEVALSERAVPVCAAGVEMRPHGSAGPQRMIYLCALKAGHLARCPLAPAESEGWSCRPELKHGPSVTIAVADQPRLFPEIPRNSERYRTLYRLRSGAERSNSAKKHALHLARCGHRRASFWLIRLYTQAIVQHARAWVAELDARRFVLALLEDAPPAVPVT